MGHLVNGLMRHMEIGLIQKKWKVHGMKMKRMIVIVRDIKASKDYWEDHATGLFAPNRISIFAASDNGYEMICLIWFDGTEEPELWVYDCNGESRYKDLAAYLQAYIDDDVSASEVKWKLADM